MLSNGTPLVSGIRKKVTGIPIIRQATPNTMTGPPALHLVYNTKEIATIK
jgi:hypothetical protein